MESWTPEYLADPNFRGLFSDSGNLVQSASMLRDMVWHDGLILVPVCRVEEILFFAHILPNGMHCGEADTLKTVAALYTFPQMRRLATAYVKSCTCCEALYGTPNTDTTGSGVDGVAWAVNARELAGHGGCPSIRGSLILNY